MSDFRLIIDGAALAELLRSPQGPVGRHLIARSTVVQARAKQILSPHRKTGCAEDSIVKRFEEAAGELAVRIQSDTTPCSPTRTSYSLYLHEGTAPHDIPGAWGHPAPFGIGGRFDGKFHPGTPPIPFLRDALAVIAE